MSVIEQTNIAELLGELNGGVFEQQINRALSDVAANACQWRKDGEVLLKFTIKPIEDSNQVALTHFIKSTTPKQRGRVIEEHITATPLHVGRGGQLTLFPNHQTELELGAGAATGPSTGAY